MAQFYNPYSNPWSNGFNAYGQPVAQPATYYVSGMQQNPQYMIQVDGEMAARAWQMPNNLPPNTIVPLWDFDGQHVYFKSTDNYGRMNPLRKGRVIFEEEQQNLPQGQENQASGSVEPAVKQNDIDMDRFVTKEDLDGLKREIRNMISQQSRNNQNGSENNRGGNHK